MKLRHLLKETLPERNIDRLAMGLSEFLAKWPFLQETKGLRSEFKALQNAKNLDYLILRIGRALPRIINFYTLIILALTTVESLRSIPGQFKEKGKILFEVTFSLK